MDFKAERDARHKLLRWIRLKQKEKQDAERCQQEGDGEGPRLFWINMFKNVPLSNDVEDDAVPVFSDQEEDDVRVDPEHGCLCLFLCLYAPSTCSFRHEECSSLWESQYSTPENIGIRGSGDGKGEGEGASMPNS